MKQMKLKGHTDTVHALLFRHDGAQVRSCSSEAAFNRIIGPRLKAAR